MSTSTCSVTDQRRLLDCLLRLNRAIRAVKEFLERCEEDDGAEANV